MYIKKIRIKDFQGHSDTEIEFSKNLNCIIGSSDAGKSSIYRALKFTLTGKPWIPKFIRSGKDQSVIGISFSDDSKIIRTKGVEDNKYEINGKPYESFGVDIPTDVYRVSNMKAIDVGKMKINLNFADQMEALFLISEPDSTKARILNKISGIDIIDTVLVDLRTDSKALDKEKNEKEERLKEINEELKNYEGLENKFDELKKLQPKIDSLADKIAKCSAIEEIQQQIKYYKEEKEKLVKLEEKLESIRKIDFEELNDRLNKIDKKIDKLEDINEILISINEYKEEKQNLIKLEEQIEKLKKVDVDKLNNRLIVLGNKITLLEFSRVTEEKINELDSDIGDIQIELKENKEAYNKDIKEYEKGLKELKKCPICGNKIDDKTIERCLSEL